MKIYLPIFKSYYLVAFFFLATFFSEALGQSAFEVSGSVKAKDQSELPYVSIIIRSLPDSTLASFTSSNEKGDFSALLPVGQYFIQLRMVGFLTLDKAFEVTGDDKKLRLDLMMAEDKQALEEVTIEERRVVTVKNDTTEFDANAFRTVADVKAIDVLKKIPGMNVRDDGSMYYKGKRIKDFLIEGESLFSQSPETLSKAFPANAIDRIQILEDYQAFGTRKEGFNQEKAINITLNEDMKNVVFGDITAGVGLGANKGPFRVQGNAFWIKKKLKTMWLADFNNIGQYTFNLRSYLSFTGGMDEGSGKMNIQNAPISQSPLELPPEISASFSAFSLVYSPSKKLKIKSYGLFNRSTSLRRSQTMRFYADDVSSYQNIDEQRGKGFLFSSENTLIYQPNERHVLLGTLQLQPNSSDNHSINNSLFNSIVNNNEEGNKSNSFQTAVSFKHLYTINEKSSFDTELRGSYQPEKQSHQLTSDTDFISLSLPNGVLEEGTSLKDISQQSDIDAWEATAKLRFRYQFNKNLKWENYAGNDFRKENERFDWEMNGEKVPHALDMSSSYQINRSYFRSFVQWQLGIMKVKAGTSLANYGLLFEGKSNSVEDQQLLIEPEGGLEFRLPFSQIVQFNYQKSFAYADREQFNEGYRIASFQRVMQGSGQLEVMPSHSFRASHNYTNLYSRIFSFLIVSYQKTPKSISQNQALGLATLNIPIQVRQESKMLFAHISKVFDGKLPMTIKADINIINSQSTNFFEGTANPFESTNRNLKLSLYSNSKKKLNTEVAWDYRWQTYSSINISSSNNYTQQISAKFIWNPAKSLLIKPSAMQVFVTRQAEDTKQFSFLNLFASYQINRKFSLEVQSFNALNTGQINTVNITSSYREQVNKETLGRYYLLSIKWSF